MNDYITPGANETESYTDKVAARLLKQGDFLVDDALVVDSASTGTKWTHVLATNGRRTKFAASQEVEVQRDRPTEAAKKIRNREYAEQSLIRILDKHRDHEAEIVKALEKAAEEVTVERRYQLGRQLDYLMDVAVLQARADLWRKVIWMFDDEESKTRGDTVATFLKARKIFTNDLVEIGRYGFGPLSRSTSLTSNLAVDLERYERVKFLDDIRWALHALDNS